MVTGAGTLPFKNIIHVVGPIFNNYGLEKTELLIQACVLNVLEEAKKLKVKSVSMPPISLGNLDE